MHRILLVGLLVAAALAAGCSGSKLPFRMPLIGGNDFLPQAEELPGWRMADDGIRRFAGRKLEKYIGTEANLIRNYGFHLLSAADYVRTGEDEPSLTIESYEMEKPLSASGIYHYHRGRKLHRLEGRARPVDVGVEGVATERVLYFYKGLFFFKIIYTGSAAAAPDLVAIGRGMAGRIPGESRPPRGFEYLAVEGVDTSTSRVTPGYAFNYDFLPPAIFASAPGAGDIAEVFIIGHFDEEDARRTAKDYRTFLQLNGLDYEAKRTADRRLVWWARDPAQGRVIVTRYKNWVFGVQTPKTYERGEVLLDRIAARMQGR